MNDTSSSSTPRSAPVRPGPRLSEDWAATVIGLALLLLSLAGVIPVGLVP